MTATNKKLHWTQTTKGKKKLAKRMKKQWEEGKLGNAPSPIRPLIKEQEKSKSLTHIEALQHLMKDVDARLEEIDNEIVKLQDEKTQLKRAFKGQQEPEQFPANGDQ